MEIQAETNLKINSIEKKKQISLIRKYTENKLKFEQICRKEYQTDKN